eukprot:5394308-Lingulodinium_polyedra.AAC.1
MGEWMRRPEEHVHERAAVYGDAECDVWHKASRLGEGGELCERSTPWARQAEADFEALAEVSDDAREVWEASGRSVIAIMRDEQLVEDFLR